MNKSPNETTRFKNAGWTLGNECPFRCRQCYSMSNRKKGRDLAKDNVDRIVNQLAINGIETVNLGGNEPLFTNGLNVKATMLPYIITSLAEQDMLVGITSAGISANYLAQREFPVFQLINDVDISLDSPFEDEHNSNRGAQLYSQAIEALYASARAGIEHTIVVCGMSWNLTERHIEELIRIAKLTESNIRINFLKPTEARHQSLQPSIGQFYETVTKLAQAGKVIEPGEPMLSKSNEGCPCGKSSFRICSITPDGRVPVTPCVYLHDFQSGDLLRDSLYDILQNDQFRSFQHRHHNPEKIPGCENCQHITSCRGGCAARAYLNLPIGERTLMAKDPYCPIGYQGDVYVSGRQMNMDHRTLVHQNYLCTYIVRPN